MRSFSGYHLDPVPGDVVAVLRRLDRASGAEGSYADQLSQLLDTLREQARAVVMQISLFPCVPA